jgi:chemotaxis response regulator CheB
MSLRFIPTAGIGQSGKKPEARKDEARITFGHPIFSCFFSGHFTIIFALTISVSGTHQTCQQGERFMAKKDKPARSMPATEQAPRKTSATKIQKKEKEKKKANGKESFPVVGIGASAGGLEALEKFFQNMPPNPRMAFIVISHLDPSHTSMMPSLLQKHSSLKVVEVEDGMKIATNYVYVIPPDRDMGIIKGTLHLMKTEVTTGPRAPVNYFFRHLAEDSRGKAVGIILSGMGSDGTLRIERFTSHIECWQEGLASIKKPT